MVKTSIPLTEYKDFIVAKREQLPAPSGGTVRSLFIVNSFNDDGKDLTAAKGKQWEPSGKMEIKVEKLEAGDILQATKQPVNTGRGGNSGPTADYYEVQSVTDSELKVEVISRKEAKNRV